VNHQKFDRVVVERILELRDDQAPKTALPPGPFYGIFRLARQRSRAIRSGITGRRRNAVSHASDLARFGNLGSWPWTSSESSATGRNCAAAWSEACPELQFGPVLRSFESVFR